MRLHRISIVGCLIVLLSTRPLNAEDFLYTDAQADCAAKMIFMNECSGRDKNLIFWSPDEDFPSLGIGHFIWYPATASGPYQESFPGFIEFAKDLGLSLPSWIANGNSLYAPWRSREEFIKDLKSDRVQELWLFLKNTKREQTHYIINRFRKSFPSLLEDLDEIYRAEVQAKYDLLMGRPEGAFAMIDYVNFKGEGYRSDGRYEGVGWGLAQVLIEMITPDNPKEALNEFIQAAERVLEERVRRSPKQEIESKWLPGWKNRLQGYRTINCT